jgi:hypothetical protein
MTLHVDRRGNRVEACSILREGRFRPLDLVSDILRMSGVKITRVDKRSNRVTGRIGSRKEPFTCRVDARIYSHGGLSLVEISCGDSLKRPGVPTLTSYVEALTRNLEGSSPQLIESAVNRTSETMAWKVSGAVLKDAFAPPQPIKARAAANGEAK